MPRSNNSNSNSNSNSSYSPRRPTFKPFNPSTTPIYRPPMQQPIQKPNPYPYNPTIQSQPIQQRSFFGNIVDGFAFGTGSTIARNMFTSNTSTSNTETKIIEKEIEKKVIIDCTEFNKCNNFKENGDKFLYNDCIKKLTNKITDYEMCISTK